MSSKVKDFESKWNSNPMLKPFIEKVVVNISVGKGGEELEKARNVLQEMTGCSPVSVRAKASVKEWGIRAGQNIATKVTLRGENAVKFIKRALVISDNRILRHSF